MFSLELDLEGFDKALSGGYQDWRDDIRLAILEANRETLERAGEHGKSVLRASLRAANLSGLEKTWQADIFPRRGLAWEPTALIYSKAELIVAAFDAGETIGPKDGGLLAVPIPGGFAEDFPNPRGPDTKVDYARQRFGERLFVIPARAGRPAILAAELVGQTKTGRLTARKRLKSGKVGKGTFTAFLFFLVPQVTLPKLLDIQGDFAKIERKFFSDYTRTLAAKINAAGIG